MYRRTTQAVLILILAGLSFTPQAKAARSENSPQSCFVVGEKAARIEEVRSMMDKLVQEGKIDEIVRLWQGDEKWTSTYKYYRNALLTFEREKYVPAFLAVARCNNKWVRSAAIEVLVRLREPALLDYLKTLLDEKPLTAEEKKAIEAEIEKLASDDETVRDAAEAEITKYGARAKPVLVPYLHVKNETQREAVHGLCRRLPDNDPGTLLFLTRKYDDKDRVVFAEAVVKREEVKYAHLAAALDVLAATKPAEYKKLCLQLVDPPPPHPRSNDKSHPAISAAIRFLANCGDPKVCPKLYPFLDLNPRYYCGDAALALAGYGDKSQIKRMKTFHRKTPRSSIFAMNSNHLTQHGKILLALLKLGDRTILDELFASGLQKSEEGAMIVAAAARDIDSVPKIINIIKTTRNKKHAVRAMEALAAVLQKKDEKIIKTIRDKIADWKTSDQETYYVVCSILMEMGDDKARNVVTADLASADADKKAIILRWIADAHSPAVLPFLMEALDDKSAAEYLPFRRVTRVMFIRKTVKGTIRQLAADGIEKITNEPFDLWDFDRDRQVREIKAWYKKYQEQKAAEEKAKESNSSDVKNNEK